MINGLHLEDLSVRLGEEREKKRSDVENGGRVRWRRRRRGS
jgi:hypothetical protein